MKIIEISYYFNNYPYMQNRQDISELTKDCIYKIILEIGRSS